MQTKETVLVVRVGRAGDMVMITPALDAILKRFPNADIHLVTSSDGKRLLKNFDSRLTRFHLYHRRFVTGWFRRHAVLAELRQNEFSHSFVFEANPHYHKLVDSLGGEIHCLKAGGPLMHYARRCLELVDPALAISSNPLWARLPVTPEARTRAKDYLSSAGIEENHFVVAFHATHSGATAGLLQNKKVHLNKSWPHENFLTLAASLEAFAKAQGLPIKIIIDVLPEERSIVQPMVDDSGGKVTLLCGPPDFERYKALIERVNLLVTPDTGPMHIAAAVGTPMVALFAGKSPEDCGPFAPPGQYKVLCAAKEAVPTQGLGAIPPEDVLSACIPFLKSI